MIEQLLKSPKMVKWKDVEKHVDKGYAYFNIQVQVYDNDLYIKLYGSYVGSRFLLVKNFKQYTAVQIIDSFEGGRHWNDAILNLYKKLDLDFGYTYKIIRDIKN